VTAVAAGSVVVVSGSGWQKSQDVSWAVLAGLLVTYLATTAALGLWSAAATATARHLTLAPRVRAAQLMLGAVLPTAVSAMIVTASLWWWVIRPSVTLLVLGLVNLALMIVIAPIRIGRAARQGRRLRAAASGAAVINPSAPGTHGRHRA
jgi:hypothetical protein